MGELTKDQLSELKEAFALFDKDGSGKISIKELGIGMRSLGMNPTDKEITEMIKDADKDGSMDIDFGEFCKIIGKMYAESDPEKELKDAFEVFDKDKSGFIDKAELTTVMKGLNMPEEDITEMFNLADTNNDGQISIKEFAEVICKKQTK